MIRTLLNLSLVLAPAASFAVVITFDDIPTHSGAATWQPNRYQSQNLLFSTNGNVLGAYKYSSDPLQLNMVGGADSAPTNGEFNNRIEGRFVGATNVNQQMATSSISFFIRNAGFPVMSSDEWEVRFYDAGGNELHRQEGSGSNILVSYSTTTSKIHHFEFRPSDNGEGIDTLTFNTPVAAVPEPGTIAALVLGVGALGARRFRKKS